MKSRVLKELSYKTKGFLKHNTLIILTCVGSVGVIATSVATAKATIKATRILEEAEYAKGEELTKYEKVKIAWPIYIPAILFGVSTISCFFGADALNKRKQISLISAYSMLDRSYKEYKDKIRELYGSDTDISVRTAIAKDKFDPKCKNEKHDDNALLFFDEFSNRYFWRTMEEIIDAEYHFNRNFILRGYADLNELYSFLGLDSTDYGASVGWSFEVGECMCGCSWVDFEHNLHESDGLDKPSYYSIYMPFAPTADFMSYEG